MARVCCFIHLQRSRPLIGGLNCPKDGPLRYGLGKAVCADGPKEGSQLGHGWGWLREVMPDAAHKVVDLGFHRCFSYGAEPPRLVTP
jgi:hypothetical protein